MTRIRETGFDNIFWIQLDGKKHLCTKNLTPGRNYYGERTVRENDVEYRLWDPYRSKLSAAIYKGLNYVPIKKGSYVLYIGTSTGTTISHISDIIENGIIFGVEVSARVAREFVERVVKYRNNIIPIVSDARYPQNYNVVFTAVDVLYSDIAQPDATDITIDNAKSYLKKGGYLVLVVKARSIDPITSVPEIIDAEANKLKDAGFRILQIIDIAPFDREHGFILSQF
ncbi:MAG: fibrillarin-like rRNA/tRNA 2'-O-methyltransferase [Conexivisphaerales archaeon]